MIEQHDSYMILIGSVINRAIKDYQAGELGGYQNEYTQKRHRLYYDSAKNYLFNKNRLEATLERTGLGDVVSINYIRHMADNVVLPTGRGRHDDNICSFGM